MTANRAAGWIDKHLWQILAAGGMAWSAYLVGQATTGNRIANLEKADVAQSIEIAALKAQVSALGDRVTRLECRTNTGECKQ
jgi:hypothetical protein